MIEIAEQFERAEEAIAKMKWFLCALRRTYTPEMYAVLSAPILRELQERESDVLAYLSQAPEAPTAVAYPNAS